MNPSFLHKVLRKLTLVVKVLERKGLSAAAKVVFAELLLEFHNNSDGRCDPAAETIGERLGRHERNVRAAIAELEAEGVLRSRRQRSGPPKYEFPDLDSPHVHDQDRAKTPGLGIQDRAFSFARPGENVLQDRAFLPDKPVKRTKRKNLLARNARHETEEAGYFRRGKEVLGQNAGGLLARLRDHKGSIALARAAVEQASTKENPREYVGRILAGHPTEAGVINARANGIL
jgi:hypothetical protein